MAIVIVLIPVLDDENDSADPPRPPDPGGADRDHGGDAGDSDADEKQPRSN